MFELSPFWSTINKLSHEAYPTCAAIELTNRCNAQCPYCYIPDRKTSPELTTKQIHFVIDKLDKAGLLFVNITGGEPFLRNDISEILEHCFNCNFFFCSIFSNGTLITDDHFELLKKYKNHIKPFRMTVFSHKENLHDSYMKVPGSFISILTTGKKLLDAGVDVKLSLPVMTFNIENIEESIDFFQNQGFIIGLNTTKLITECNNTPDIRDMISLEFYRKLISKKSNDQIAKLLKPFNSYTDDHIQLCRGIHEMIMIDIHGDIHPCTSFRKFTIGSILSDTPLHEILSKNKEYLKLKNLTINDLVCKQCNMSTVCFPCLAHHHTTYGTLEGPYPQNCNIANALFSIARERELL